MQGVTAFGHRSLSTLLAAQESAESLVASPYLTIIHRVAIFLEIYWLFLSQSDVSLVKGQIHPRRAMMGVRIMNEKFTI